MLIESEIRLFDSRICSEIELGDLRRIGRALHITPVRVEELAGEFQLAGCADGEGGGTAGVDACGVHRAWQSSSHSPNLAHERETNNFVRAFYCRWLT